MIRPILVFPAQDLGSTLGWTRTLYLEMARQMFYHRGTSAVRLSEFRNQFVRNCFRIRLLRRKETLVSSSGAATFDQTAIGRTTTRLMALTNQNLKLLLINILLFKNFLNEKLCFLAKNCFIQI